MALVLGAVVLLALAARLGLHQEARVALLDPDVLQHVHRARTTLAEWPRVPTIDTFGHHGREHRVHWMGAQALLHAGIARAQDVGADDLAEIHRSIAWLPALMGAAAAALAARLAATVLTAHASAGGRPRRAWVAAVVAGTLAALSGDALALTRHGQLDHGAAVSLGMTLCVLALVCRSLGTWWLGLATAFLLAPTAPFFVTLLLGAVALAGAAPSSRDREAPLVSSGAAGASSCDAGPRVLSTPWAIAPVVACAAGVALTRGLDPAPPPWLALDAFHPGALHVAWMAMLGAALVATRRLTARGAPPFSRVLPLAAAIALGSALLAHAGELRALATRLASAQVLSVAEEQSPLAGGPTAWTAWTWVLVAAGLALAVRASVESARIRSFTPRLVAILLPGVIALGLLELRFLRVLSPLVALAVVRAAADIVDAVGNRRPTWRAPVVAVLAFLVGGAAAWHAGAVAMRAIDDQPRRRAVLGHVLTWLESSTPDPGASRDLARRRSRPADWAVFAPWHLGHHVNVIGDRPVVVDPFNHVGVVAPSRATWLAETPDALVAALQRYDARYLFTLEPAWSALELLPPPRDAADAAAIAVPVADGRLAIGPRLRELAAVRLWLDPLSDVGAHLQPRYLSPFDADVALVEGRTARSPHGPLPIAQVHEVKAGALLRGRAPPGAERIVATLVLTRPDGATIELRRELAIGAGRSFAWRTALPAPVVETSFASAHGYVLSAAGLRVEVAVSQEAVDRGATLTVSW